jgi:hypothetical protein
MVEVTVGFLFQFCKSAIALDNVENNVFVPSKSQFAVFMVVLAKSRFEIHCVGDVS